MLYFPNTAPSKTQQKMPPLPVDQAHQSSWVDGFGIFMVLIGRCQSTVMRTDCFDTRVLLLIDTASGHALQRDTPYEQRLRVPARHQPYTPVHDSVSVGSVIYYPASETVSVAFPKALPKYGCASTSRATTSTRSACWKMRNRDEISKGIGKRFHYGRQQVARRPRGTCEQLQWGCVSPTDNDNKHDWLF